jgi:hypothetical protein
MKSTPLIPLKLFKDILNPNIPLPRFKRSSYIQPPNNSSKKTRPNFPRWLRRSTRGKNKRHIKRIVTRAENQGFFLPSEVATLRDGLNAK